MFVLIITCCDRLPLGPKI